MLKKFAAAAAFMLAWTGHAVGQTYPTKPVRIIVPFPAGQSGDILARLVGAHLTKTMGQAFIVDNRPGAGGTMGTDVAVKAAPDGYTLLLISNGPYAIGPALYPRLPYSPARDLAPIASLGITPQLLVANPDAGFNNLKDFVTKGKQGEVMYASSGNGSTQHLTMELLRSVTSVPVTHVPFKGAADAQMQVINGQIPLQVDSVPSSLQYIKTGKLKGIAITSLQRSPFLPNVPTVAEQGYPGFEALGWFGIAAPAQTPAPILDKLHAAIQQALAEPSVKERLEQLAVTAPSKQSRAQFAGFLDVEIKKWGKVVKDSGAKIE
jgi:tripartite-type tricarboxylate transporter receptor subunit TctC